MQTLRNIYYLTLKEFRSVFSDPVLLILIVYIFTMTVYDMSRMTAGVKNAAVAVVDYAAGNQSERCGRADEQG